MDKNNNVPPPDDLDDNELGSIEDRKKKIKDRFFDSCKKGDLKYINKIINDELLDVLEPDENKWTALQWAVVNNHPEVVKVVYKKEREVEEEFEKEKKKKQDEENARLRKLSDFDEAFKKPANPLDNGKYTPLHWSAYKGFDVISSILLKMGCDPLAVDAYGNNALHQACAGNHLDTCKLFLGLGVEIKYKNSRSHMAIDLTTNKAIQDLIQKMLGMKKCTICEQMFNFYNRRYLCSINDDHVICSKCAVIDYYYVTETAEEKDIRDCRCRQCADEISKAENDLTAAIKSNDLQKLIDQYEISKNFKICLHLKKFALENLDRLEREKKITELLDSLKVVPDHKTILKSVEELKQLVQSAEDNKVQLDSKVIERAFLQKNRLEAERDLRQVLDNVTVAQSTKENLDNLSEKVDNARKCNVDASYVDVGADLVEKIRQNLAAKEILQMFTDYPPREYPVVEVVDPKKKKKAAPSPPKKKKRKKKEPPFIVPEWAKDLNVLIEKVAEFKTYVSKYQELGLSDDFNAKAKEQLVRFGKEVPFRKEEEETLRRLEEERAKRKKNKKKKK